MQFLKKLFGRKPKIMESNPVGAREQIIASLGKNFDMSNHFVRKTLGPLKGRIEKPSEKMAEEEGQFVGLKIRHEKKDIATVIDAVKSAAAKHGARHFINVSPTSTYVHFKQADQPERIARLFMTENRLLLELDSGGRKVTNLSTHGNHEDFGVHVRITSRQGSKPTRNEIDSILREYDVNASIKHTNHGTWITLH